MTSIRALSAREEIIDITAQVQKAVATSGHRSGLVAVYCPHTTAGISVNENADPDVKSDMVKFLGKLANGNRYGSWNSTARASVRCG